MRQESNHRMNSGERETQRISNSRAMGVIILIALLFVFQVTTFVVQKVRKAALGREAEIEKVALLESGTALEKGAALEKGPALEVERFPFNPNSISKDSLQLLGFSPKQAQTILNYRSKGGKFHKKRDFAKMYVVDSAMYTSLAPYILLPDNYQPARVLSRPKSTLSGTEDSTAGSFVQKRGKFSTKVRENAEFVQKRGKFSAKMSEDTEFVQKRGKFSTKMSEDTEFVQKRGKFSTKRGEMGGRQLRDSVYGGKVRPNMYMCNLNTADSAALVQLWGIGGYYAKKILRYRERLGGSFVSTRQLLEIEGFTQERFSKIEDNIFVSPEDVKGFSIIGAERKTLEQHPYIGPYAARGIVTYLRLKGDTLRNGQGRSETELYLLRELVKERILTPENGSKLEEYLLYLENS